MKICLFFNTCSRQGFSRSSSTFTYVIKNTATCNYCVWNSWGLDDFFPVLEKCRRSRYFKLLKFYFEDICFIEKIFILFIIYFLLNFLILVIANSTLSVFTWIWGFDNFNECPVFSKYSFRVAICFGGGIKLQSRNGNSLIEEMFSYEVIFCYWFHLNKYPIFSLPSISVNLVVPVIFFLSSLFLNFWVQKDVYLTMRKISTKVTLSFPIHWFTRQCIIFQALEFFF